MSVGRDTHTTYVSSAWATCARLPVTRRWRMTCQYHLCSTTAHLLLYSWPKMPHSPRLGLSLCQKRSRESPHGSMSQVHLYSSKAHSLAVRYVVLFLFISGCGFMTSFSPRLLRVDSLRLEIIEQRSFSEWYGENWPKSNSDKAATQSMNCIYDSWDVLLCHWHLLCEFRDRERAFDLYIC